MSTDLAATEPFASLAALRAAHMELLRRHRTEGETPDLMAAAKQFLSRTCTTGAVLAEEEERQTAQSLIDYWSTTLYRAGTPILSHALAEFDSRLAPQLPDKLCPYLGLDAFDEASATLFFGRRRIVSELIERLHTNRLIAVIGPSGSGKSSLIRAGLLPTVRVNAIPGSADWQILPPIVPGSDPTAVLERALGKIVNAGEPLVLIIDQFEETFTLCTDAAQREIFLDRLVALVTDPVIPHRVVLTMRSDFEPFIARAETLQPLYEAGKVTLPPLTAGELREAIERPAEQVGLKFEAGVVNALLGDILGEPAALPLLQYSLLKLWEARERNRATLAAYKQLGNGRQALARGADAVYNGMIPEEQLTAKRILLRLVRPGEGLEITSNRLRRAELDRGGEDPGRVERVLNKLVEARLLRLTEGKNPQDTQVEVAHEALVRNWPTLVEWLENERVALRQRQRLSSAAEQWQRLGRDPGALFRGRLLEEARAYEDSSELEQAFVQAGVAAEEAQTRRDLRTKLIFLVLPVIGIFGLISVVLAVLAFNKSSQAQDAQQTAEAALGAEKAAQQTTVALNESLLVHNLASLLASRGEALQSESMDAALLVGAKALSMTVDLETQSSLLSTLSTIPRFRLLHGHTDSINIVAFSPNNNWLVSGDSNGTIIIWDPAKPQQPIRTLAKVHSEGVFGLAFSPGSKYFASGSSDDTLKLWDVTSGKQIGDTQTIDGDIKTVAWSQSGTYPYLAAGSGNGYIKIWDVAQQESPRLITTTQLLDEQRKGIAVLSLAFYKTQRQDGGMLMASGDANGQVILWKVLADRIEQLRILAVHTDAVNSVVFSNDDNSSRLASGSSDRTIIIWETNGPFTLAITQTTPITSTILTGHSGAIRALDFLRCSCNRLTSAGDDRTILRWNLNDLKGYHIEERLPLHSAPVLAVALSQNERMLVSAGADHQLALWDLTTPNPLATQTDSKLERYDHIWATATISDGTPIAVRSYKESDQIGDALYWWNINQPIPTDTLRLKLTKPFTDIVSVAISPKLRLFASGHDDGTVRLWNSSAEEQGHFQVKEGDQYLPVHGLAFNPDGTLLAVGSFPGSITVWNVSHPATPSLQFTLPTGNDKQPGHTWQIIGLQFSPDGKFLASSAWDKQVILWDIATQKPVGGKPIYTGSNAWSLAFSADSSRLALGTTPSIMIWNTQDGKQVGLPLQGHTTTVQSIAFNPTGTRLASGSADGQIIVWDVARQQKIGRPLQGEDSWMVGLFYLDNDEIIAANYWHIWQWKLDAANLHNVACQVANRDNLTEVEWNQYIGLELPYNSNEPICTLPATGVATPNATNP